MSDSVEQAYNKIDTFLKKIHDEDGDTILNIGDLYSTSGSIAFNTLFDEGLVTSRKAFKDKTGIVDISSLGIEVLTMGGIRIYLNSKLTNEQDDREALNVQRRKDKIDLELSEKALKDFPRTRKQAIVAFWLAIALAIFELTKFVLELVNPK